MFFHSFFYTSNCFLYIAIGPSSIPVSSESVHFLTLVPNISILWTIWTSSHNDGVLVCFSLRWRFLAFRLHGPYHHIARSNMNSNVCHVYIQIIKFCYQKCQSHTILWHYWQISWVRWDILVSVSSCYQSCFLLQVKLDVKDYETCVIDSCRISWDGCIVQLIK